ncbi:MULTISPECIES: glycine cleavage system protein GcvH [Pelosinus]|jgi:glycine cleavage system H protein|uniref:Glycine cleavage system H protein n=1 Tax=Pelosinus fermentans B4 TaxID=1149862 RepID=I8RH20_9FIRM|nr:glycine cleavage system protein GcvH [Pelosinus fermentans]EIW18978.1 glycine cleavage system H protein [Pelosinus fermentans B4]EIW21812.1 Glycine cleavage system H protein [Pelosinus fermentans A11]OAM95338.1 Glycine cleavage system H protein [Pelosinus fermentans DSM 17108]SDR26671.1 glycine cleavage system H protein [Pelosinus fermentans]
MNIPKELKYSKDHEWVKVEGNVAIIGVTDFAQSQLGDVVFVELPDELSTVKVGDSFSVIESVKAVSDIYAPVSGKIVKVNQALTDSPDLINQEPYGEGWIVVIEMSDSSELDDLLDSDAYAQLAAEGGH